MKRLTSWPLPEEAPAGHWVYVSPGQLLSAPPLEIRGSFVQENNDTWPIFLHAEGSANYSERCESVMGEYFEQREPTEKQIDEQTA